MLSPAEVRRLLAEHGLRPSRALGQNFVVDPNTVRRIARLAEVGPGDDVVEIGPGLGSLTLALADTGARVLAIEVDRHLVPVLREVVTGRDVEVLQADALTLDWSGALAGTERWTLVANLPYNVATPVVMGVLEQAPSVVRLLVMVQREVGERLAASPGDQAFGAPSVKVGYWGRAEVVGRVPASVFFPVPRVESVLVAIDRAPAPAVDPAEVPYGALFGLVRAGFAQRRKMLRSSLRGWVDADGFARAEVDPTERAEQLGVEDWGRLARWAASGRAGAEATPANGEHVGPESSGPSSG